jgi:Domain of unknown function (DUF5671)
VTTIRRIYAYLLAIAGLAMFSIAAANLLQLLIDLGLHSPAVSVDRYVRDTVSLYAAAALVGLPVWLAHWLWIARSVRSEPAERASSLRRLYLYAVLAGAMLEIAGSLRDVLLSGFASLIGVQTPAASLDVIVRPLPFILIGLCVWFAHWRIAADDRALVGERGGSATLRRWYTYGAAFVGLVLLLTGTSGVVEALWRIAVGAGGSAGLGLAENAANALLGLGLWFVHWVVLPRRLSPTDERDDETTSVLHSVYLFLALAVSVIGSLLGMSQLLYYAVARLLGVDHPGGVGGDLLQAAAGPASTVIVYGVAWAYQRDVLRRQPAASGKTPRQAGVRRLYTYLVALVALGVLATGVAGLLWTLGDVVFVRADAATGGASWREQAALYATLCIVGLPVWLLHWRPNAASATSEARSLARRLYVYLSLIVAMLALVGSAAVGLYQLLGIALGASLNVSMAADLMHAFAIASVAAVLAAYHWRVVRADAHRARHELVPGIEPTETSLPATIVVEIQAADSASLCTAMSTLRTTGVQVRVIAEDARASRP